MRLAVAASMSSLALAPAATAEASGCHARWPTSAYRAGPGASHRVRAAKVSVGCGVSIGYATSETTLAVANDGAILFSPANSENTLARSTNAGASWKLVGPSQLQYTSLWNTVDPQVVVDRRTGRLFWVHTTYTEDLRWPLPDQSPATWLVPTAVANAHGFQVYSSRDTGRSWRTADYSSESTADWEKLFVGPPPAKRTGQPQPAHYPDVVYLCANAPEEVIGPGRACYKSLDGGVTFTSTGYEFPSAVAPSNCPALAANTGVVAGDGAVYIPQSCADGTYLAVSRDEGASYSWLPVAGAPPASGLGAVVQLAIDRAGDLYVLWLAADALELVSSHDGGRDWSAPQTVSPPGLHSITLPALSAGPRGCVGIVYYASGDPSAKMLSGYISQTTDALSAHPLVYDAAVNDPTHPIFENYGDSSSPRADFIGATYDGRARVWGAIVKQLASPGTSNRIPTTGYLVHLTFTRRAPTAPALRTSAGTRRTRLASRRRPRPSSSGP